MANWIVLCTLDGKRTRLSLNGAPATKSEAVQHVLQTNAGATNVQAYGPRSNDYPEHMEWSTAVLDSRVKASPNPHAYLVQLIQEQAQRGYTLLNADDARQAHALYVSWHSHVQDILVRIDRSGRWVRAWQELPETALLVGTRYFSDLEAWGSHYHAIQSRADWLEAFAKSAESPTPQPGQSTAPSRMPYWDDQFEHGRRLARERSSRRFESDQSRAR